MEIGTIVSRALSASQLREVQALLVELHDLPSRVIDTKFADLPVERRITKARTRQSAIRSNPIGPKVCKYCGIGEKLQRHHLIPARLGGRNVRENLIWLCEKCHGREHDG